MTTKSIKIAKSEFKGVISIGDPLFNEYKDDSRQGIKNVIKQTKARIKKQENKKDAFRHRFYFENKLKKDGYTYIAGVDEVGRGPLAGPVVSAAVVLSDDFDLVDVNDSKQLSDKERRRLEPLIEQEAVAFNVAVIDNNVIDRVNIYEATKLAMKAAIEGLTIQPDHIIVDAMDIPVNIEQTKLIKGDAKSNSVAAASILAKVYRDDLMKQYSKEYPEYDFQKNNGYGTASHLQALKNYGVTPIHRKTFAPIAKK